MVQWLNVHGLAWAGRVLLRPSLAMPHVRARSLADVDFAALRQAGIRAVVLDKDNCITRPYAYQAEPLVADAWARCREVFGDQAVILSNSAGSADDPGHAEAAAVEAALGARVVRHARKKPACGAEMMAALRTTRPEEVAVIGDRVLTDVVLGNSSGCLSILTAPFGSDGDNKVAAAVRSAETRLLLPLLGRLAVAAPPHAARALYSAAK